MKNNTSEPPGRAGLKIARRNKIISGVINLPKETPIANAISPAMETSLAAGVAYHSVDAMVHAMRPAMPVHCLRPATIASTAKWFLRQFPGEVMYAVKTNPDPRVLSYLARAGVKNYDVASLVEVKQV